MTYLRDQDLLDDDLEFEDEFDWFDDLDDELDLFNMTDLALPPRPRFRPGPELVTAQRNIQEALIAIKGPVLDTKKFHSKLVEAKSRIVRVMGYLKSKTPSPGIEKVLKTLKAALYRIQGTKSYLAGSDLNLARASLHRAIRTIRNALSQLRSV